jgi:hypothetical protein
MTKSNHSRSVREGFSVVSGKLLLKVTGTAGTGPVFQTALNPAMGTATPQVGVISSHFGDTKLSADAAIFAYYKFTRFDIRAFNISNGQECMVCVGYEPDVPAAGYSGLNNVLGMSEVGDATYYNSATDPNPSCNTRLRVSEAGLLRQNVEGWKCNAQTGQDPNLWAQGSIAVSTDSAALGVWLEIDYRVRMWGFTSATDFPMRSLTLKVEETSDGSELSLECPTPLPVPPGWSLVKTTAVKARSFPEGQATKVAWV